MKVSLSRSIQTAPYESINYSVELDASDLRTQYERFEDTLAALHLVAYAHVLQFEQFHKHVSAEQRMSELKRAKSFFMGKPAKSAKSAPSSSAPVDMHLNEEFGSE